MENHVEYDFCAEWLNQLLKGLDNNSDTEVGIYKNCAKLHYNLNQMDQVIEQYIGDLDGFIQFLTNAYGWIISISEDGHTLIVDENKEFCVCPIAARIKDQVSPNLCNCSAHYASMMFTKVCQREVKATVSRSFIRDGKSCIYKILI